MPVVRVVIPTYNRAAEVVQAVATVRRQTFTDFALVVADDGSGDDTVARVQALAADDPRISVLALPHAGVAAARNAAVSLSGSFTYVAFLDADDRWEPDHLAASVDLLEAEPDVSLAFGLFRTEDHTGTWTQEEFEHRRASFDEPLKVAAQKRGDCAFVLDPERMLSAYVRDRFSPMTSTVVVRAAAVRETPWFDTSFLVLSDLEFYLRLGQTERPWAFLNSLQAVVRFIGDNLTRSVDLRSPLTLRKQRSVLRYREKTLAAAPRDARDHARRLLADQGYLVGQCCAEQGDRAAARRAYARSLQVAFNRGAARGLAGTLLPQGLVNRWRSR